MIGKFSNILTIDLASNFFNLSGYFVVILLAVFSAYFAERAGIINIAVEAFLIFGALVFSLMSNVTDNIFLGLVAVLISGIVFSLFFTWIIVFLKAEQVIAGTAFNIFTFGIAVFFVNKNFGKIEVNYQFSNHSSLLFVYFLSSLLFFIVVWYVYRKTKFGLWQRAIGENPYVVESAGINVIKQRVIAVLLSGLTATAAGVFFILAQSRVAFHGTVNGTGFIAIAILIVSQRKIIKIPIFSFLFALVYIIVVGVLPFLESKDTSPFWSKLISFLKENKTLFFSVPFLFSIFVLMLEKNKKLNKPLFLGKKW